MASSGRGNDFVFLGVAFWNGKTKLKNHFWQTTCEDQIHCRDCGLPYSTIKSMCPAEEKHANDFFKPDGDLLVTLIARFFTRNNPNPVARGNDRLQLMKNISNIAHNPELHLAYCIQLLEKYNEQKQPPTFEVGMVFGAALAMGSCSRAGEKTLRLMLADVERQQDTITTEEIPNGRTEETGNDSGDRKGSSDSDGGNEGADPGPHNA